MLPSNFHLYHNVLNEYTGRKLTTLQISTLRKFFASKGFFQVLKMRLLIERKNVSLMSSLCKILPTFKLELFFCFQCFRDIILSE